MSAYLSCCVGFDVHAGGGSLVADPSVPVAKSTCDVSTFCFPHSELSAAFAWHEPARHHHKVHFHGQEGDQQAAQTEGEEERVDESRERKVGDDL